RRHTRFSRDWSSDVCSSDLRFGFGISAEDDVRIASLMALIGSGHSDRVMLAHDSVVSFLSRGFNPPPEIAATLVNWKPTHLIKKIGRASCRERVYMSLVAWS